MSTNEKIWFITGVSGGLGRMISQEAAHQKDTVIGTVRHAHQLQEFENLVPGRTFAVQMDVTHPDEIKKALDEVLKRFGRIDVLVNNAGYGLLGAIEEISDQEARAQMETNFFGALEVTRQVLPIMRQQKSGHIIQLSSIAGLVGGAGAGLYNASKFALEGFSEALSQEIKIFNISVTLVEPGPFRTNFLGSSIKRAQKTIEEYAITSGMAIHQWGENNGKQEGDPKKAARVIVKVAHAEHPPLHLPLGKNALDRLHQKLSALEKDMSAWKEESLNTSFE
ncbi:oxidoreductase [Candidatus Nucleicultrix amoebiphila]|jgi:NAD(P)-dependent dehydrogenase (short-subunit alcohol dehydrogenase family)|uniref:Short-chain dehydrogenase n=1 Tax=Candidatus Nucleicultrix amoebiphila FS5 TaxID=1414854 RepID=A0A1W6N501_9PROT|nr:oxidoreductase [Candidatus Nucleicultrix amoebiphila]ARN84923.1 hypothetical protein GQ61_06085 [Candidatus Nucleicultrix amoebiphila FS5]